MPTNTIEAFFVGSMADIDPNESNWSSENVGTITGMVFGSAGTPLYDQITSLTLDDADGDGVVRSNDNGQSAETIWHGGVSSALDTTIDFNATVTYADGSSVSTGIMVLQDVSGRLFLAPYQTGMVLNDDLGAQPIVSIRLDSVCQDNFGNAVADLEADAFIDGEVDGTGGNDTIGTSFVDADGTRRDGIDGNDDEIFGYAGNDFINAGLGDDSVDGGIGADTILGGAGNDTITGDSARAADQTEYVVEGFIKGENFTLNSDDFGSAAGTVFTVDSGPVQIRFLDNDANMDGDTATLRVPDDMDGQVEIDGKLYSFAADY